MTQFMKLIPEKNWVNSMGNIRGRRMNMRNTNDGKLPMEHRGQEQIGDGENQESKQKRNKEQQPRGQGPSFLYDVGPDLTIPQIEDGSHKKGIHMKQQGGEEPTLFGQSQFKNNLGPVYAIPSVPWQHEGDLDSQHGHGQGQENNQWQQWASHPQAYMPCCGCFRIGYWHY